MPELKVKITAKNYEELRNLVKMSSLDLVFRTIKSVENNNYSIEAFIFQKQLDELRIKGYQVEILEDLTKRLDPRSQVSQTNRFQTELDRLRKNK